jgi:lipid-binding SYLF domain-containing protein
MKTICALLITCLASVITAEAATEQEVVNQSASILRAFRRMPERGIPASVMRNARGLAIVTVVKVGFGISGKGGQGVVVARTGNGWSGPSFVGTGGAGWGPQIGAQITEFVFVLNTNRAVRAFARDGNVTIGADASAAAGPVGRDVQAAITPTAAIYTYSRSKGLFAGASLEGAVIATQKTGNARYYGRPVSAGDILSGSVAPPPRASVLRAALGRWARAFGQFALQSRANFATFSDVRTIVALLTLLLGVFDSLAQEQEPKLIDRLLKPNTLLKNSAQDKRFAAPSIVSTGKRFRTRSFSTAEKSLARDFPAGRAFTPREFAARHFRAGDSAAYLSTRSRLTRTDTIISTPAFSGARIAPESGLTTPTAEFAGNRPFLAQGKSQKYLRTQNKPLTIEEVRELLNKSK